MAQFATDYIDVASRLIEFRKAHPEGSLQPADPARPFTVMDIGGKQRIVVVAAAYRTPDDPRPGIGMAYEEVPGKTQFTRDSELQNAETSAWGRAIVAALAADTKKGIASAEEVRNRQADQDVQVEKPRRPAKPAERSKTTPADDPFYAPEGEVPPTPEDKRETDQEWFGGWLGRVIDATDATAVQALREEAAAKYREGKVSRADAEQVAEALRLQTDAIERAAAKDWPDVAKAGDAA